MENPFESILNKMNHIESLICHTNKDHKPSEAEYLQVDAAAKFLSISPNAVRVLVHRNAVPHIKKLGKNYFLKTDLISWLEEGRVRTEEEILTIPSKRKAKRNHAA
ncbi:MAG: DNA-binding protein [Chryseobacterium sp.]|nr:MAG: DNA-binding protein [Chryseobacterium sp.]